MQAAGRPGLNSRQCLEIFIFSATYRTALGPIQPPVQWVAEALAQGAKRMGREDDHSPPSSAEVKNAWSCTSNHGVVLS
jgi:hypothetical protein